MHGAGEAVASQISNPIAAFTQDNNGAIMEFDSRPCGGGRDGQRLARLRHRDAVQQRPRQRTGAHDRRRGKLHDHLQRADAEQSYIDSGTNSLSFNDNSIPQCTGNDAGCFCPTSTVSLTAENKGLNGVTSTVSFSIANTDTLFGTNDTAFNDLGGPGSNGSFAWGFPFFLGRAVYVALQGATTPGGAGPYFAY